MPKTYTAVPSVSTGDVYTAASYNTYTATNISNLIVPPSCQVRRTTDLTPYTAGSNISWSSIAFDTDGMWSAGSPTAVTIQTSGLYVVTLTAGVSATATLTRVLPNIKKNGSTVVAYQESQGSSTAAYCSMSMIANLVASDTIYAAFEFVGGSNYAVRGNTTEDYLQSRLTVTWIGRTS